MYIIIINHQLKLIFYQEQTKLGEANLNLAFYIENNLPSIIDKISIQSKYDKQAYVEISLCWNRIDTSPD